MNVQRQEVLISELSEWKNNSRIHTQRNLLTIKNSLETFGQVKPLIVQKSTMSIIAGNGTFQAMKALGWEKADCYILDIDDKKAEAYCIVDNRATDQSEWDQKTLMTVLQDLSETDEELLNCTGFDATEMEKMLQFLEDDPFGENKKEEKKEKENKKEEKKEQKNEVDFSAETDGQVAFVLMGCPFVTRNEEQILELKSILQYFADDVQDGREKVSADVFKAIEQALKFYYYGDSSL